MNPSDQPAFQKPDKKYYNKMKGVWEWQKKRYIRTCLKLKKNIDNPKYIPVKARWNYFAIAEEDIGKELYDRYFDRMFKVEPHPCLFEDEEEIFKDEEGVEEEKSEFIAAFSREAKFSRGVAFEFEYEPEPEPADVISIINSWGKLDRMTAFNFLKSQMEQKVTVEYEQKPEPVQFTCQNIINFHINRAEAKTISKETCKNYCKAIMRFALEIKVAPDHMISDFIKSAEFIETVKDAKYDHLITAITGYLKAKELHTGEFKHAYDEINGWKVNVFNREKEDKQEERKLNEKLVVTYDQLIQLTKEMTRNCNENIIVFDPRFKDDILGNYAGFLQKTILQRMYNLVAHTRRDLYQVSIADDDAEFTQAIPGNYIDLTTKTFHLREHKTSKEYQNTYPIDDVTIELIHKWRAHPEGHHSILIHMSKGRASDLLRDPIKKYLNIPNLTINDLRRAHATQILRKDENGQPVLKPSERREEHHKMCHSPSVAEKVYCRDQNITNK
ncbi:MAG: hypothetical protein ACR2ON_03280 [Paracoccaceae bacterium]